MSNRKSGVSFELLMFALFLVFLVLRVLRVIDWKWYIVAIPIWIYLLIFVIELFGIIILDKLLDSSYTIRSDNTYFYRNQLPNPDELQEALSLECSPEQMKSDPEAKRIVLEINLIRKCNRQNNKNARKLAKHWR